MGARVFLYRPGHPKANSSGMVEVIHVDAEEAELAICGPKHVAIVGDSHYDGVRSPIDGTDISSKTKRRAYMKANGLADYDDFKGVWAAKDKEREAVRAGHFDTKARKDAIDKAFWQVSEKGYKPAAPKAEVLEKVAGDTPAVVVSPDVIPDRDKGKLKLKEHE